MKLATHSLETCIPAEPRRKVPKYRVLVAGIGNVVLGDDAFGGEVIRYLLARYVVPQAARIQDFGIRGDDLALAIGNATEAVILIAAAPRGDPPGTSYLLEFNDESRAAANSRSNADVHSLDPVSVLRLVHDLSRSESAPSLCLIGCEPAVTKRGEGFVRLSALVAAAVPHAAEMVRSYLARYFRIHLRRLSISSADGGVAI